MAPLGIITIVISAIRLGGPMLLKASLGRARENTAAAEMELMSSTSREVCELYNGQSIVRCQGSALVWEFILVSPSDSDNLNKDKAPSLEFVTLDQAVGDKPRLGCEGECASLPSFSSIYYVVYI